MIRALTRKTVDAMYVSAMFVQSSMERRARSSTNSSLPAEPSSGASGCSRPSECSVLGHVSPGRSRGPGGQMLADAERCCDQSSHLYPSCPVGYIHVDTDSCDSVQAAIRCLNSESLRFVPSVRRRRTVLSRGRSRVFTRALQHVSEGAGEPAVRRRRTHPSRPRLLVFTRLIQHVVSSGEASPHERISRHALIMGLSLSSFQAAYSPES
jgi:hypothetical protein